MENNKRMNKDDKNVGVNTASVAALGAVIGASIALAGVAAANKDNRKKIKDAINKTKARAGNYIEDLQKKAKDSKEELQDNFTEAKDKVEKAVKKTLDSKKNG